MQHKVSWIRTYFRELRGASTGDTSSRVEGIVLASKTASKVPELVVHPVFRATRRIRLTFFRASAAASVSVDEISVYPWKRSQMLRYRRLRELTKHFRIQLTARTHATRRCRALLLYGHHKGSDVSLKIHQLRL